MKNLRSNIVNKIESLNDINGICLTISDEQKTLYVEFETVRSLDFKFVWSNDHFIGYFVDNDGKQSQAVISLWSPLEAVHFVAAYCLLIEIRSGRK